MISAIVYFSGPETEWAGKVAPDDVIARREFRWRWLARVWACNLHGNLDPTRCGWLLADYSGEAIEHCEVLE